MPPPRPTIQPNATRAAFEALLRSLGCDLSGPLGVAPARAAKLWGHKLLHGQGKDLGEILGNGAKTSAATPLSLLDVGIHMLCPHHLTVAFGRAHLAYVPNGRLAGLGRLTRLLESATARLVLQEEATQDVVDTLVTRLGARAAVACIEAQHPCNNLSHPRAHTARVVTWAAAGDARLARELRQIMIRATVRAAI